MKLLQIKDTIINVDSIESFGHLPEVKSTTIVIWTSNRVYAISNPYFSLKTLVEFLLSRTEDLIELNCEYIEVMEI